MDLTFDPGSAAGLGHRLLIGLQPTHVLAERDRRLLSLLKPAGVVLFRGNFLADAPYDEWLETHRRLVADVREAIGRREVLFCIDHEGGGVLRPPLPVTPFAYAREWGGQAADVGRAMAVELRSLAMNVDFAPVLDVNSNPANPVIGRRAFGATPGAVNAPARAFLDALQAEGVLGCPKHFPGHGDTATDSHYALPVIDVDPATLRERELATFRHFTDARMIMTAHIVLPQVDPGVPATMSRKILTGLLREELGFKGVVVTDDLGMAAVSAMLDAPETAMRLANSGCDLFCMCAYFGDTERVVRVLETIGAGYRAGEVPEAALRASFERIEALLKDASHFDVARLDDAVFTQHASLAPLRDNSPRTVGGGAEKA